jgi:hypothetical protein
MNEKTKCGCGCVSAEKSLNESKTKGPKGEDN